MAGATEGLDLNQALDVQSNVAAQVALNDDVSLIDVVTDLSLFFQSQVLDARPERADALLCGGTV